MTSAGLSAETIDGRIPLLSDAMVDSPLQVRWVRGANFATNIADSAPTHLRATSFGAFFFASGIAALLASLGAGLLWDRGGPAETFTVAAGVAGLAGAMLWLLPAREAR